MTPKEKEEKVDDQNLQEDQSNTEEVVTSQSWISTPVLMNNYQLNNKNSSENQSNNKNSSEHQFINKNSSEQKEVPQKEKGFLSQEDPVNSGDYFKKDYFKVETHSEMDMEVSIGKVYKYPI